MEVFRTTVKCTTELPHGPMSTVSTNHHFCCRWWYILPTRRSYDRLIFTMGFTILARQHLHIESGPGPRLNIKTIFPRYGDSHVKDMTVARPSYLSHGDPYTGKTTSLYWDGPLDELPQTLLDKWATTSKLTLFTKMIDPKISQDYL